MIRTRNVILAVVVGVVVFALGTGGVAGAATTLHAKLSGKKEVPKAGNGTGTARLTHQHQDGPGLLLASASSTSARWSMGHIHKGGKTEAGPVFVGLFASPTKKPTGCVKAKKSEVRDIVEHPGRYYVNVHTAKYPAGAARGQLHK